MFAARSASIMKLSAIAVVAMVLGGWEKCAALPTPCLMLMFDHFSEIGASVRDSHAEISSTEFLWIDFY